MAVSNAVWGIDIGQCALKALRCRPHEKDERRIVAEAFDYIEYPKILTQPEADPVELVRDALQEFLSRNDVSGDSVAISVAGQSGLARFIKLPPVESKKIPDIVKYEARQQIPFALEDVVWDYQQLTGGSEADGFALEPEVGLFAMKRDQVARALQPLEEAGIEVDVIQLSPLSVYNYVCFDLLESLQDRTYKPEDPPESTIVISLGTDTTDLVVTNGYRVWQRNIPIGGNHFTRALSKDLKLTFVKAEHLKRNAMQADDPKAVFQAMRPVFSDLLAEIQRSLGYFLSLDKSAKFGEAIAMGNPMKLPGLQRYLMQNLEQDVKPVDSFGSLSGGSVTGGAQFKENILSFAVAYGLCVQGLSKAEIQTNLLPEEIVRTRLVRAKKPWAVAGVAALLLGLTLNYFMHVSAWSETGTEAMTTAISDADRQNSVANGHENRRTEIHETFGIIQGVGANLVSNVEGRFRWLELFKAVSVALPKDTRPVEERKETAEDISNRDELHFNSMDCEHFDDLQANWFTHVQDTYWEKKGSPSNEGVTAEDPVDEGLDEDLGAGEETGGTSSLTGQGWVIQLTGYHYHNGVDLENERDAFINNGFIKNLEEGSVELPNADGQLVEVPMADLGISHAWVVIGNNLIDEVIDPLQVQAGTGALRRTPRGNDRFRRTSPVESSLEEDGLPNLITLKKYEFIVQFVWQPTTHQQREELAQQRREQAAQDAADRASAGEDDSTAASGHSSSIQR